MPTYTVFAVYDDDQDEIQPYCTSVQAKTPEEAMLLAQEEADESNEEKVPLAGFQVVLGDCEVVA